MKEGLKEKGLTEKELSLVGDNLLEGYRDELKGEMQSTLENNIEGILDDIKTEHLSPIPWIIIIYDPNSHVGTGIELKVIEVSIYEDIIEEIHKIHEVLREADRADNIVIPMRISYTNEFIHQLRGMVRKIEVCDLDIKDILGVTIEEEIEDIDQEED